MKLHVELEDGKAEDVFVPAAAIRDGQNLELDGVDLTIFLAWWAMHRRGLTDIEDWSEFAYVASVMPAEDSDPKAPTT